MAGMFGNLAALFGPSSTSAGKSWGGYDGQSTGYAQYPAHSTANHMRNASMLPAAEPRHQPEEQDEASEREDLLDQHVAYYLKHHPEVHAKHSLTRVRPGVYNFNGREISVEWHYADDPDQPGHLIAIDGPLRQPFSDYMQENENGIEYDDKRLGRSSLSQVPKGNRLSFGDTNKVYSRLEAMKVAKEQSKIREEAANYAKDGMAVPQHELMARYKKTISQKLGERRQRRPDPELNAKPQLPAEAPAAAPAPTPAPSPPPTQKAKNNQTHGSPKYCSKHNKTEKRKKCQASNKPCSTCSLVIQTNYVEFTLCPTCSEKDHRCMCCGAPAEGVASAPQAQQHQAPSSPMNARSAPPQKTPEKMPTGGQQNAGMSPMTLFGMPDLFGNKASEPQSGASTWPLSSGWQAPASIMTPQGNVYASQRQVGQQNHYATQNAFASYNPANPLASQNVMMLR